MIITKCEVCEKEFTPEELDTIDTGPNGLHGQHIRGVECKSLETDRDADCNCWEDGNQHFAHPHCCPACNSSGPAEVIEFLSFLASLTETGRKSRWN